MLQGRCIAASAEAADRYRRARVCGLATSLASMHPTVYGQWEKEALCSAAKVRTVTGSLRDLLTPGPPWQLTTVVLAGFGLSVMVAACSIATRRAAHRLQLQERRGVLLNRRLTADCGQAVMRAAWRCAQTADVHGSLAAH